MKMPQHWQAGPSGLQNQGATCYLNSLMQVLCMTPGFATKIHEIAEKKYPVTFGLRQLFHQIRNNQYLANTDAITKALKTKVWQQRDVQEFWHELVAILEGEGPKQADLIKDLFQGEMKDYVICLECGREDSRKVVYLDIPLVVKPYFKPSFSSVQESLESFIAPQILDESNQCFCSNCDKKCDAEKGLAITKVPRILTLQLMRFEIDMRTLRRVKLNTSMTFPEKLNLRGYLADPSAQSEKDLDYELFAVLVHSGSTDSGHYFAYARSQNQWYICNDSRVRPVTQDALKDTYGGSYGGNAYMLMYQRVTDDRHNPQDRTVPQETHMDHATPTQENRNVVGRDQHHIAVEGGTTSRLGAMEGAAQRATQSSIHTTYMSASKHVPARATIEEHTKVGDKEPSKRALEKSTTSRPGTNVRAPPTALRSSIPTHNMSLPVSYSRYPESVKAHGSKHDHGHNINQTSKPTQRHGKGTQEINAPAQGSSMYSRYGRQW